MFNYDGHIHIMPGKCDSPQEFYRKFKKTPLDGGTIISLPPKSFIEAENQSQNWKNRLNGVLDFCENIPFDPFFWLDPSEVDAITQIETAKLKGIAGIKIICNHFAPEKYLPIYQFIANLQMPILFHTGILWDGKVSSSFVKPLAFECLLNVMNLHFKLAHVGWPWCDEFLALYGKFRHAEHLNPEKNIVMYIDTTPGTPVIYREEIISKLYTIGYFLEDKVSFGTDCCVNSYNFEWANFWLNIDTKIIKNCKNNNFQLPYSIANVPWEGQKSLNDENFIKSYRLEDKCQALIDKSQKKLTPEIEILLKNGQEAGLSTRQLTEFENNFNKIFKNDDIQKLFAIFQDLLFNKKEFKILENPCLETRFGKIFSDCFYLSLILANFNYAEKIYKQKRYPLSILKDSIKDIGIWVNHHQLNSGSVGIDWRILGWEIEILNGKVLQIGRLQCNDEHYFEGHLQNVLHNTPMINIHIPANGKLDIEDCKKSMTLMENFFKTYRSDFKYKGFVCYSWLFDEQLKDILGEDSNIVKFQKMGTIFAFEEENETIWRIFGDKALKYGIRTTNCVTSTQKKISKFIENGGKFKSMAWYILK